MSGLNLLAVAERWEMASQRSRTTNLRDWQWLETRLRALPDELGKMQPEAAPLREAVEGAQQDSVGSAEAAGLERRRE